MTLVMLTYFKQTGKYYSEGSYESKFLNMWEIQGEVKDMLDEKRLPDLMYGHSHFSVLIECPLSDLNVPHLIK